MMDQVGFEVSWFLFLPGDAFHGYISRAGCWCAWGLGGQARLILSDAGQDPLHRGHADPVQLLQQLGR